MPLVSSVAGCPTTYRVTDFDIDKTLVDEYVFDLATDPTNPSFAGIWVPVTSKFIVRYFFVRVEVQNMNKDKLIFETSARYYFQLTDPCIQDNAIVSKALIDMEVWVKDPATTQAFIAFDDLASAEYGAGLGLTDLCGPKKYELYHADQTTAVTEAYLSLAKPVVPATDYVLSLATSLPKDFTNAPVSYYLKVYLDDYFDDYPDKVTLFVPFQITIFNC